MKTKEKFFEKYLEKRMKEHGMPHINLLEKDTKMESLLKRFCRRFQTAKVKG